MNIGAISSSLNFSILRHFNAASNSAVKAATKLAAGSRVVTAADNPSAIGQIESLKSKINETKILSNMSTPMSLDLKGVATQISSLAQRATLNVTEGTEESMRSLVDALRGAAGFKNTAGVNYLAGDPDNLEQIVSITPATSASVKGSPVDGSVSLASDSMVMEGGSFKPKATLSLEVDSVAFEIKIDAGDYTREEALANIQSAISSQVPAGTSLNVQLNSDNEFVFSSNSTGATSNVSVNGPVAATLNISGTNTGTDEIETVTDGAAKPLVLKYGERDLTFINANAAADKIEKALNEGNLSGALSSASQTVNSLNGMESNATFTASRLENDKFAKAAQMEVLESRLDNLTGLNVAETAADLASAQVKMAQASWAMSAMEETRKDFIKALFSTLN